MLKEIKEIKLKEFEEEKEKKILDFDKTIEELQMEKDKLRKEFLGRSRIISWIKQNITSKSKYKRFQTMNDQIEKLYEDRIKLLTGLIGQEDDISEATEFSFFGLDFFSAISFLKEHGCPIVLGEDDLNIEVKPSKGLETLSDLVLVRKEKHAPMHSVLEPSGTGRGHNFVESIEILGQEYQYSYPSSRNTIHFAVNGEVGDHVYGNWKDCRYAIIMPYDDAPREQMRGSRAEDTYFEGSIALKDGSIILCPKGEGAEIGKNNPGVTVIEYDGPNVTGYAQKLVAFLGYVPENIGMWSWINDADSKKFADIIKENGLSDFLTSHSESKNHSEVDKKQRFAEFIGILKVIKENNIIKSPEDIEKVYKDVLPRIRSVVDFDDPDFFIKLDENGFAIPSEILEIYKLLDDDKFHHYMETVKDLDFNACYDDYNSRGVASFLDFTYATNPFRAYMEKKENQPMYETFCKLIDGFASHHIEHYRQREDIFKIKIAILTNEVCKQLIPNLEKEEGKEK